LGFVDRMRRSDFGRVFNFDNEINKGRTLTFINTAVANIANIAITGALYTAFLAENGIDIVRVGIISFIPYISWLLSIFSPTILSKFRKRQKLLLLNDFIYYGTIVLATTIMPLFVEDPTAKTVWFAVLIFIGNMSNALVGSGYTSWLIKFVPKDRDLNVYVSWSNMVNLIGANLTGIIASMVATGIAARGNPFWFLFGLRLGAFVLFVCGSMMIYLIPREEPTQPDPVKILPRHVLTEPIRHRPFLLTALITVFWGIAVNMNANTYSYYLLETVKAPMSFLYIGSVSSMVCSLCFSGVFRRLMDRVSPYRMIAIFLVVNVCTEFLFGMVAPGRVPLYAGLAVVAGLATVGFNMGYNSLFYLHIPENANRDLFATFWNLTVNISAFVGSAIGTWILAAFERHGVYNIFGMDFYGSQLLCMVKVVFFAAAFCYLMKVTPRLMRKEA